jgi:uncharacterized protein (DUF2236 family)
MEPVLPGLFEEDSVTRRVNRENVLLLGGGRALLMQLAHPMVARGVDEHSDFRKDPIRRLRRTIRMTMAIVFGDRETALSAARAVNQAHARVRGEDYRALDPDLLLWVHATLADTALVTYETFVKPLLPQEREDFYQDFKLMSVLLGIPRDHFPATLRDFETYLAEMMSTGPVRVGARARELADQILRPRLRLVPGPFMVPLEIITTGLLPATLRDQYGLAWGPSRQRAYRLAARTLPPIIAFTPPRIRVWPLPGRTLRMTPGGRAVSS